MRKKVFGRQLSREMTTREALFVSLVSALVENDKIITTKAKARSIVGLLDHLVTLAKKDTLSSKREILKRLKGNKEISKKLWNGIAKKFADKKSGFTRIVNLPERKGDLSSMVRIEWSYKEGLKLKDDKNLSTKKKGN